jgi:hypothetical protein
VAGQSEVGRVDQFVLKMALSHEFMKPKHNSLGNHKPRVREAVGRGGGPSPRFDMMAIKLSMERCSGGHGHKMHLHWGVEVNFNFLTKD